MEKDLIILNLLIGWEIIHLTKSGKKLSISLREIPGNESRFLRITFEKCFVVEFLNFSNAKEQNISTFNFTGCIFARVNIEHGEMINIHLLKDAEFIGSFKIVPSEIGYKFTAK